MNCTRSGVCSASSFCASACGIGGLRKNWFIVSFSFRSSRPAMMMSESFLTMSGGVAAGAAKQVEPRNS